MRPGWALPGDPSPAPGEAQLLVLHGKGAGTAGQCCVVAKGGVPVAESSTKSCLGDSTVRELWVTGAGRCGGITLPESQDRSQAVALSVTLYPCGIPQK